MINEERLDAIRDEFQDNRFNNVDGHENDAANAAAAARVADWEAYLESRFPGCVAAWNALRPNFSNRLPY